MPRESYLACVGACAAASIGFNWQMAAALERLRNSQSAAVVALGYAIWLAGCGFGFWAVGRWTARRWMDALGSSELPGLASILIRFCLLSPVLSAFALLASAAFPTNWFRRRDGAFRIAAGALALALLATHSALWALSRKREGSKAASAEAPSATPSPAAIPLRRHLEPYLPISSLYAIKTMDDLSRIKAASLPAGPGGPRCHGTVRYGQAVQDCALQTLSAEGQSRRFASGTLPAAFGMAAPLPSWSREAANDGPGSGSVPTVVATAFARVEWTLARLESRDGDGLASPREELAPRPWTLAAVGSPEIPLLNALLDGQRFLLVRRLAPVLERALQEGEAALAQSRPLLHDRDAETFAAAREELGLRVAALKNRPLALAR